MVLLRPLQMKTAMLLTISVSWMVNNLQTDELPRRINNVPSAEFSVTHTHTQTHTHTLTHPVLNDYKAQQCSTISSYKPAPFLNTPGSIPLTAANNGNIITTNHHPSMLATHLSLTQPIKTYTSRTPIDWFERGCLQFLAPAPYPLTRHDGDDVIRPNIDNN